MKITIGLLLPLLIYSSALAGESDLSSVMDRLDGALTLLAESGVDPCPICGKETRNKAFRMLNAELMPGRVVKTSAGCLLVSATTSSNESELAPSCYRARAPVKKKEGEGEASLPRVTFRFHTDVRHLVGVAPADFTVEDVVADYRSAPAGMRFSGVLEIVEFKYGDGPTYNYYPNGNQLQIHCRVFSLTPMGQEPGQ
jgi:hypothetical protein